MRRDEAALSPALPRRLGLGGGHPDRVAGGDRQAKAQIQGDAVSQSASGG